MSDTERRRRVKLLLPEPEDIVNLDAGTFRRAAALEGLGFKPADALHVAAAEATTADAFLSCDDRLCRVARRVSRQLRVRVANPLDGLKEIGHGPGT